MPSVPWSMVHGEPLSWEWMMVGASSFGLNSSSNPWLRMMMATRSGVPQGRKGLVAIADEEHIVRGFIAVAYCVSAWNIGSDADLVQFSHVAPIRRA
jgi:hypothetical protein